MRDGERLFHAPTLGEHTESVLAEIRGRDGAPHNRGGCGCMAVPARC
ncbi:MAG: hypothetical protein ACI9W2_001047 [Gammaproteobacteria bacterium]|jgi:hypothetical protein